MSQQQVVDAWQFGPDSDALMGLIYAQMREVEIKRSNRERRIAQLVSDGAKVPGNLIVSWRCLDAQRDTLNARAFSLYPF